MIAAQAEVSMGGWMASLQGDPLPWLLEESEPAVRHAALLRLFGRSPGDPEVVATRAAAMAAPPIAAILAHQEAGGYWTRPGAGYGPKYTGTAWQIVFLDQLGADGSDPRIQRACAHLLQWSPTTSGGLGISSAKEVRPPPSMVVHCLNGNLLRALIGFGWLEDERVQRAIDWQARSITGEDFDHYYKSTTSGPGFRCGANYGQPCAWGGIRALHGLARVPADRRAPHVVRALERGGAFLLSRDPAVADYPMGPNTRPNRSWFKPGFPSGYVASVLDNLEVLCELGHARDPRLGPAFEWLLSKQDGQGRWKNEYAYTGKTWVDIEQQGQPSKWVTLRACAVLRSVAESC
jgi:hypothetical protein